ncbi:MAG: RNA 2',3'-cyclic phosphodiesterase [Patescibacteria group bacterium]|nr:MAG: RNA 2',3'-cyclic phosphodiesterase [Patescibacteria group bacterium]
MRLFLAIDLPEKEKIKLERQITALKKQYPQFNWVTPENFHITIYFFGERQDTEKIIKKISDLLWDQSVFYLYSLNLDVFVHNKLVTYLTFQREKRIEQLAMAIKNNFDQNSNSQKKFIPHLTLARSSKSSKQQYFALKRKLSKIRINISFPVEEVFLFESILTDKKPIYKKIATFKLLKD